MDLGAFSISLTVKDIKVSKEFYEKFGFEVFGGQDHLVGAFDQQTRQADDVRLMLQGCLDKPFVGYTDA